METSLPRFCIIVPCYNEEDSIPALVEKLTPALDAAADGDWQVLLVDDGSSDGTARMIWELNTRDRRFQGLRLSRNFGHQPAVTAGLQHASGQCIGVIDCDLQDPVEILVQLYEKVSSGEWDVCSGVRGHREEAPWWLRCAYRLFYRFMAWMAEHDYTLDSGDFCVFNRRVHRSLLALRETLWVPRGLRSWVGFRQTTLTYRRPPRVHGQSKYNVSRLMKLAVSNITSFSTAPLRLATWIGLRMGLLTLLAGLVFLINRLFPNLFPFGYRIEEGRGTATIVLYGSFIASMLFFCLGIMGEYIAVIVKEVKRRPSSIVMERTPGLPGSGDGISTGQLASGS
ncbi:MAG: glycosyltransferase [Verrucomicrobiales bacterium]|nr:glycosyltransferase [Verrucomicrobiales bacterium]